MFTVLIAEKHYIDAIRLENKLFFEPFLENKELAFCCWNPEGQNLNDSVPGLIDTVGRKKEWKAVIINSCSDETAKQKNPFDIVDSESLYALTEPSQKPDNEEAWSQWEESWNSYYSLVASEKENIYKKALQLPLQKLTTWLSFRPADYILKDVEEKDDVHDWAINEIGHREISPASRLERLERMQYRNELKLKEILRREFVGENSFDIAYPKEIYCISRRTAGTEFFSPDSFWNNSSENEYSNFCDLNMYLDKVRFLVFNLLPETHKNFRCDKIRFLSTVLVFATNTVPSSTMDSRRLYVFECKNDDTPLFTLATSYDKKLAATYEVIDNEIERIYSEIPGKLTDKAAKTLFCTPVAVEVKPDESSDYENLYAEDDFALLPTYPNSEIGNWERSFEQIQHTYDDIIRQQRRSVKKGIDKLNVNSELSGADVSRLTSFQLDDIRDFTENSEDEMIKSLPPDLTKASKHEKLMMEKSDAIKDILAKRISRLTAVVTGIIILFLAMILYAPFIVANLYSSETVSTSLGMLGITLVVLFISLLITLVVLKLPLTSAIKDFNDTMHHIADDINNNLKRFTKYFSVSCNVRRGYKVQGFAEKNLDEYTKSIRIRRKHQEDIRKKRAELEEMYHEFIGDSQYYEKTMIQPYDYDFEKRVEYSYDAPFLAGFCRNLEFLGTGNYVEVPCGYITHISVRMEEIYDR